MKSRQISKDDAYTLIAMAITRQAAKDYQTAWRESLEEGYLTPELIEVTKWFKSPHGQLCSFGLGEVIMERIRNNEVVLEDWEELLDD